MKKDLMRNAEYKKLRQTRKNVSADFIAKQKNSCYFLEKRGG